MKVLFLQNVKGLGKIGEVKDVNDGYAQNFLIPKKFAEPVTAQKIANIKNAAQSKIDQKKMHDDMMIAAFAKLEGQEVELHRKVNSTGSLFGGIHPSDIRDAINATYHIHVSDEYIKMKDDIRTTGEFKIRIGDKQKIGKEFEVKVKVVGQ
jgi:large subunit ribosomal protein L9